MPDMGERFPQLYDKRSMAHVLSLDSAAAMQNYVALFHQASLSAIERGNSPVARVFQRKAAEAYEIVQRCMALAWATEGRDHG